MKLTFTGGKELVLALRRLPRAVRQRVLVAAMLAGGGIIERDANARAPIDAPPRRRTGRRLAGSVRTVVAEQRPSGVSLNVTTRDRRAHLVEFGHQIVPRGRTRRRVSITRVSKSGRTSTRFEVDPFEQRGTARASGFVPPRPFLRPAFDNNKQPVLTKIGEVLGAGIEAEAKRLAQGTTGGSWAAGPGVVGVA